jgi:hypothetical protein
MSWDLELNPQFLTRSSTRLLLMLDHPHKRSKHAVESEGDPSSTPQIYSPEGRLVLERKP